MTRRASSGVTRRRSPSAASETGTTPRSTTASSAPVRSTVSASTSPSFHPGHSTTCRCRSRPAAASRSSTPREPAAARPMRRTAGGVVPGVQRDVERREPELLDALDVGLTQVRERHEVAVQEGQPVVVVLDGQGRAQAGRHLVDEAEAAGVAAGARVVAEPAAVERDAVPLARSGRDHEVERVAVAQHGEPERAVGGGVLHVEDVERDAAVQADDAVAGAQPAAGGGVSDVGDEDAAAGGLRAVSHRRGPGARARWPRSPRRASRPPR